MTATQRRCAVQGRVLNSTGATVAGATVAVVGGHAAAPDIAAVTADDGTFSLPGLLPGSYEIQALHGRSVARTHTNAATDRPASIELHLTP